VDYVYDKCYDEYIKPNLMAVVKDWLLMYTSNWGARSRPWNCTNSSWSLPATGSGRAA
jgi:hypothetical protein